MGDFIHGDDGNESSSFEDAIDDSDQSNSSDSEQSCVVRNYWQDWGNGCEEKNSKVPLKTVPKLLDICAPVAARHMSFDHLEQNNQYIESKKRWHDMMKALPESVKMTRAESQAAFAEFVKSEQRLSIPEKIIVPIIRSCFPDNDTNIRLYSCLANGSTASFKTGQTIFNENHVRHMIQIGYFISATVEMTMYDDSKLRTTNKSNATNTPKNSDKVYHVAISVDRCRITSATCTCEQSSWCHHIVAACLYRLYKADKVEYRATIWDSVNELSIIKLKKMAQWFINELPREYLPVAQRLIDELRDSNSYINLASGAPDPTDGGHEDVPIWSMDPKAIHNKIGTILIKFVKPSPIVHCDVQMLNSEPQPPVANEYKIRRTVLKSKQPSALWNFFDIVREMFRRHDENATTLLHMITADCLAVDQITLFWYEAKLLESGKWHMQLASAKTARSLQRNSFVQLLYEANALFDEIVKLWKVAALNPRLTGIEREQLSGLLQLYHKQSVSQIWRSIEKNDAQLHLKMVVNERGQFLSQGTAVFTAEFFPGFHAALEACQINFRDAELRGVPLPVACLLSQDAECINVPLLRNNQHFFSTDLNSARKVTIAILGGEEVQGLVPTVVTSNNSRKHKSKKKSKRSQPKSGSNSLQTAKSGSSKSSSSVPIVPKVDGKSERNGNKGLPGDAKEPYNLQLEELFATSHVERQPLQIRMDACDALSHHGYPTEAAYMAVKVGRELLYNTPNVLYNGLAYSNNIIECPTIPIEPEQSNNNQKKVRRPMFSGVLLARQIDSCPQKVEVQMPCAEALHSTRQAVEVLERSLRLMHILLSGPDKSTSFCVKDTIITSQQTQLLALELGVSALLLPRYPAPTHQLEVYLNFLETEIHETLESMKLPEGGMIHLRNVALQTIERCQHANINIIPPTMLSLYLLEIMKADDASSNIDMLMYSDHDCVLSWRIALLVLESRLSYVEEDYPMMFECVRKQRRFLALTLINLFKDNISMLSLVFDRLLDPSIHRMHDDYESNAWFFLESDSVYAKYAVKGQRPCFPIPTKKSQCTSQLSNSSEVSQDSSCSSGLAVGRRHAEDSSDSAYNSGTKYIPSLLDVMRSGVSIANVAPHATEALSQFYADLAQKLLHDAGGIVSSSIFTANNSNGSGNNNSLRIHRNLHLGAFAIGMYAVGIHNATMRNWHTRTQFGFNVGWLQAQALEIGVPALKLVRQIWQRHFTAIEAAGLADKASHRADREIIHEGTLLAVSVLYKANLLNANEAIVRLRQCREFNMELTEQACIAIETVAGEHPSFYPCVLFQVARYWSDVHDSVYNDQTETANVNPRALMQQHQQQQHQFYSLQEQQYAAPSIHNPYINGHYSQQALTHQQYDQNSTIGLHPSHSAPNLHPQNGMPHPPSGIPHPPSGIPHPQNGIPHPQNGISHPQNGISHPQNGISHPQNGMPHPQNGIPHPQSGIPHLQSGMPYQYVQDNSNHAYYQPQQSYPSQSNYPNYAHNAGGNYSQHMSSLQTHYTNVGSPTDRRMLNSYRVGMLAMKAMRLAEIEEKKTFEDHMYSSPYEDDLKFLLNICHCLGVPYINSFYQHVAAYVHSPHLLYPVINESIKFYGCSNLVGTIAMIQTNSIIFCEQPPITAVSAPSCMPRYGLQNQQLQQGGTSLTATPMNKLNTNHLYVDLAKIGSGIQHVMSTYNYHETTIALVCRCIDMCYIGVQYRLNYPRLQDSDCDVLRRLLTVARLSFQIIPNGRNYYDAYIRYWRTKSCKKKIQTHESIKQVFDEFVDFVVHNEMDR